MSDKQTVILEIETSKIEKAGGIEKMKERLYASASGINERILSTISVKSVADCGDTSFKCDYRVKDGCHHIGECSVKM
jgi:hypothetical protein